MKKVGKKGFTIIELMVSFSLSAVIIVYLFNIIIILKDLYVENGIRTQLLINQSSISKSIETTLGSGSIQGVASCGVNCAEFTTADSLTHILQFNPVQNSITFENVTVKLIDGSKIGSLVTHSQTIPSITTSTPNLNDSIFSLTIPITHKVVDGSYAITIVIPYNSRNTSITI